MRPFNIPLSVAMRHSPLVTFRRQARRGLTQTEASLWLLKRSRLVPRPRKRLSLRNSVQLLKNRRRAAVISVMHTSHVGALAASRCNSSDMQNFNSRSNMRGALRQRRETL